MNKNAKTPTNVSQAPRGAPSKAKKANANSSGKTSDPDLQSYALALASPFNEAAIGARVPDMYSYPTATYHCEGTIVVNSSAGGSSSFLLGAHPYVSLIDITGGVSSAGMQAFTSTTQAYSAVTQANMDSVLQNYRCVGVGFQIRNLIPPTAATGRVIIAKVPTTGPIPGPSLLNASPANYGNGLVPLYCGINTGGSAIGFATDLIELPDAQEFTIQDIISSAVEVTLKPISPSAFDFHDTQSNNTISASLRMIAGGYETSASGVSSINDSLDVEAIKGWDCMLVNINGLPVSTPCIEVKYIYHFEGTPVLPSAAGAIVPGIAPRTHINPMGHSLVLSKVLSKPSMKFIGSAVGSMADAYFGKDTVNLGRNVLAKLGLTI